MKRKTPRGRARSSWHAWPSPGSDASPMPLPLPAPALSRQLPGPRAGHSHMGPQAGVTTAQPLLARGRAQPSMVACPTAQGGSGSQIPASTAVPGCAGGMAKERGCCEGKGVLCPRAVPSPAGPLSPATAAQPRCEGHRDGVTRSLGVHPGTQLPAPRGTLLLPRGVNSPAGGTGSRSPSGPVAAPPRESGSAPRCPGDAGAGGGGSWCCGAGRGDRCPGPLLVPVPQRQLPRTSHAGPGLPETGVPASPAPQSPRYTGTPAPHPPGTPGSPGPRDATGTPTRHRDARLSMTSGAPGTAAPGGSGTPRSPTRSRPVAPGPPIFRHDSPGF